MAPKRAAWPAGCGRDRDGVKRLPGARSGARERGGQGVTARQGTICRETQPAAAKAAHQTQVPAPFGQDLAA